MKWLTALILSLCVFSIPAREPQERVEQVLADLQRNGYTAPDAAAARLLSASGAPQRSAPVEARRLYHGMLASLYISAGRESELQAPLGVLKTMAERERCEPCRFQVVLLRAHLALRRDQPAAAGLVFRELDGLPPPSAPDLIYAADYLRSVMLQLRGDHKGALRYGRQAASVARDAGWPSQLGKALNQIMVSHLDLRACSQ